MSCVMLCWRITSNIKQFSRKLQRKRHLALHYIQQFQNAFITHILRHAIYNIYVTIWELVPRIQRNVIQRNFITSIWISTGTAHWNILIPQVDRIRTNFGMITLSDILKLYYSLSSVEIYMVAEENHPSTFLKKYC